MSEWVTVEVKGLDELQKALEKLELKMAKRGVRQALKAGANVIRAAMIMLAPKKSGFLAEHFGTKVSIRRDEIAGSAFIGPQGKMDYPDAGGGHRVKWIRSKNEWKRVGRVAVATVARFLEFGTSKMGKKPFMTQAFESFKDVAQEAMIEELREAIKPD